MGLALTQAGSRVTASVLDRIYGMADTNITTVTAASATALSTAYTIPANDAVAGTAYRLICGGNGTWGSTQQALHFQAYMAGSALGGGPTILNTAFAVSAAFKWKAEFIVYCGAIGVTGWFESDMDGCVTQTANSILPGTAADNTVPFIDSTTANHTQDTTASIAVQLYAWWAATTGAPTITCRHTLFEKVN